MRRSLEKRPNAPGRGLFHLAAIFNAGSLLMALFNQIIPSIMG